MSVEWRVRCALSSKEGHRMEVYPRRDRDRAEVTCKGLNALERMHPHGCEFVIECREVGDWVTPDAAPEGQEQLW